MLYKLDSTGKVRSLLIRAEEGNLIQTSGLVGGKLTTHSKKCKGKNIGKINETTPVQQAESEAASKIRIKLSQGYFKRIEDARSQVVILPMLAKDYKKESKKINWKKPVFIQPKLDGMRNLAFLNNEEVLLKSRKNNEILTMGHIENALFNIGDDIILDGELYAHGLSFQENMKLIKKERGNSKNVKYHVYDMVGTESFEERFKELIEIIEEINSEDILLVETIRIKSEKELKAFHTAYLAAGYEGTIVRHGDAPYKVNGRSSNLLKYKDFSDIACEIIDIVPSDSRPTHGVVVCKLKGQEFRCGLKMPHSDREEILIQKKLYIGKQLAEVRYFELTDKGIPRFPVCVGFRLDK